MRTMADTASTLDPNRLREEFPVLHQEVNGHPLVYLDNAATSQSPRCVIEALTHFYEHDRANIHRGVHALSQRATAAYEGTRAHAARFIGASDPSEIIYVRGTTEGMNLIASTWGRVNVGPGDEVLITEMEHHSGIVPWQMLCQERGADLKYIPIDDRGDLELDRLPELIGPRTRVVSLVHVSNALGTVNPLEGIVAAAHAVGAVVVVDGAQAVPHLAVDVQAIGCDFYVFSAHKMYGPTGIGVVWGRRELLEGMPPWQSGGDMIRTVSLEKSTFNTVPHKFEAGTPSIADVIALDAALDWIDRVGIAKIAAHERELLDYATERLERLPGLTLVGTSEHKAGVVSFVLSGAHPHDIGTILDQDGVAIRAGHHCAQPVMTRFGIPATARASFAAYNTKDDVDRLVRAVEKVQEMFGHV